MFKACRARSFKGDEGERRIKVPMVRHKLSRGKRVGCTRQKPLFQRVDGLASFIFRKNPKIKSCTSSKMN
jgi:hypothetical protein